MESSSSATVDVPWSPAPDDVADPVVARLPYVELKLEHEGVEATRFGEGFFPDAVPYETSTESRVFYWRCALVDDAPAAAEWAGACATPIALTPVTDAEPAVPRLAVERPEGWEVVVEGTVAGDARSVVLEGYEPPSVAVRRGSSPEVTVAVDGEPHAVAPGDRTAVRLPERPARVVGDDGSTTRVVPRLSVRYPGRRTLYHPAPGGDGAVFPAFGLELETLPNPVPVPVSGDELDHRALASALGVDLTARPYPERVLWQAFAYQAFDPHRDTQPRLGQPSPALLGLANLR
ncbi:MAG: hypothetical protein ABEJ92_00950 [Halobacteriales archaeon]